MEEEHASLFVRRRRVSTDDVETSLAASSYTDASKTRRQTPAMSFEKQQREEDGAHVAVAGEAGIEKL
jgi:hypothetical protein